MSRNKRRIAAVVAGVGLAGSAVALAVPPLIEQDEVSASIVWTHSVGYDQRCGGPDEFRGLTEHATLTGVATGDPRLSGDVELRTVLNIAVGPSSTQVGTLRIRDPRTGEWKAQGRFAIAGEDTQSGGLVGTVRDPARPGGTVSDLIGPFSITFGRDAIVAQIGGEPGTEPTPAVIARRGNCGGRKFRFDADLTPDGAAKAVGARRLGWH